MFNKDIFKIHYFDPSSITVVGKDRYTKDIVVYIDSEPLPHSHSLKRPPLCSIRGNNLCTPSNKCCFFFGNSDLSFSKKENATSCS